MPQGPIAASVALNPSNYYAPTRVDAFGDQYVATGKTPTYNVSAITVIKATPGRLVKIIVNVASSTAIKAYDVATTGGAAAANTIYTGPTTSVAGTVISLDWPCSTGIVVDPGTGGTVSVAFV